MISRCSKLYASIDIPILDTYLNEMVATLYINQSKLSFSYLEQRYLWKID